ncbi:ABC transporter ATP-binding protein [Leucobacter denitrificans]|uniref:Spermidine/putrescine import ATP-binding protein PotA n=1 Tax=Leucobacter denitrificans TaxID=683042 RepID=A0A7G9S7E3_9MICO|nr:ABC transporter ATP-binding protein [Leucobacter denitrificans]QNN63768.1 ABC transporter ATP-binding protein [Leucobacter denitrificans]
MTTPIPTISGHDRINPADSPSTKLTISGARKTFVTPEKTHVNAIDDVSFSINQGEFFVMLGPSGCGKTTLLRTIAGLDSLDEGEIHLGKQRIDNLAPHARPVNTVFQSYALFPHLTVAENIAFGLEMERRPKQEVHQRVQEMLELVQLQEMANRKPAQLSGGQQQRVALARSLAKQPQVLLLDEPLAALDLKLRRGMQSELKRLQRTTGITFVFVTHDQEEALSMGDRIAVFNQGRPEQIGTPEEIYEKPSSRFVADFIGETNFVEAQVERQAGAVGAERAENAEGERLVVTLPGGDPVTLTKTVPTPGDRVTLTIRPERIRLTPGGVHFATGEISRLVYMGTDLRCTVTLSDGTELALRVPPPFDEGYRPGSEVKLYADAESLRPLAPEAQA